MSGQLDIGAVQSLKEGSYAFRGNGDSVTF